MQGKLTQRLVDSLKPAEKVYIVRDTDLTGFILRVQENAALDYFQLPNVSDFEGQSGI